MGWTDKCKVLERFWFWLWVGKMDLDRFRAAISNGVFRLIWVRDLGIRLAELGIRDLGFRLQGLLIVVGWIWKGFGKLEMKWDCTNDG